MIMKILTSPIPHPVMARIRVPAIVAVGAILLAAGCATTSSPPTEQLAMSRAAVTTAIRDGGNEFAPLELKSAREKMESAERAMAEEEYVLAGRLAEQAQLDAKLAEIKTSLAKAQKSIDDSRESNRVLREEIERTAR